jgi:hypothetical protein
LFLDGYNLMPFFKGEVKESPRKGFVGGRFKTSQ